MAVHNIFNSLAKNILFLLMKDLKFLLKNEKKGILFLRNVKVYI